MESVKQWHGFLGSDTWPAPIKTAHCDEDARPGYHTEKAHEYADTEEVLREKVLLLAEMIKRSENCVVYSGAGLSTSSGIGDYATKSNSIESNKKKRIVSGYAAQPSYGHRALVSIFKHGLIKYWVQQNHDGLPQKAGLPQEYINEIHGAWYDPTNPVVPMSGSLRSDLFTDMLKWEARSDLTISVGSSMCGMNADRVFTTVAEKSIRQKQASSEPERALGGVIIGIQKTQYDNIACLHIFARIDEAMKLLLHALNIDNPCVVMYVPRVRPHQQLHDSKYIIQYDSNGKRRINEHKNILDLNVGARVKMVSGPYKGDAGIVKERLGEGHYKIEFVHTLDYRANKNVPPYKMSHILGSWYIEAAVNGTLPEIPVVNVKN